MLHRSFKPAKCKTALKLAVSRIKLLKNKKDAQVKQIKRELAQLLESGQYRTARIRVEHVVREEKLRAAYELIEIYCELVAARLPMVESQKNCPIDLKEAVSSVIFASPRCADVPELMDIRKHFTAKYGKEFVSAAVELRPDSGVSRMLIEKLSTKSPDGPTKMKILAAIAEEHNVKWDPEAFEEKPPEDLLHGPNTFGMASMDSAPPPPAHDVRGPPNVQVPPNSMASKAHVEPPSGPPPPDQPPIAQVPRRNYEYHDGPMNSNEQNARSSPHLEDSASTNVSANKATTSAKFHPETTSSETRSSRTEMHVFPGDESSSGRQNWNMQFKDAASAAQAAAESAELAGMAARAAAELSRQYSSEMHNKSNQSASVPTNSSSMNNDHLGNSLQTADRYPQKKSPERHDILDKASMKRQSGNSEDMHASEMQTAIKPENIPYFGDIRSEKKSSRTSSPSNSSVGSDHLEDVLKEDDHINYFADLGTGKQSIRSSSPSHSGHFSNNHENFASVSGEGSFVSDVNIHQSTIGMNSEGNAPLVFDDSGSDDDNYKGQESSLFFSSPARNSFPSATSLDPWSFEQKRDEVPFKSVSPLRSSSGQHSLPIFSEGLTGSTVPSEPNDFVPVTFDASDGPSSDSEEELDTSKLVLSKDSKFSHEKIVQSINSGKSQSASHRSLASSSSDEVHPERTQGIEYSVLSDKRFDDDELPGSEPSPRLKKSGLDTSAKDDLPQTVKDGEECSCASDTDNELLAFGVLKGGLRNKGYRHPPYNRNPSGNAFLGKQITQDTPTVRTSDVSHTSIEEPYSRKGSTKLSKEQSAKTPATHVTPDDDSSEDELSHETLSSSRQDLYNQKLVNRVVHDDSSEDELSHETLSNSRRDPSHHKLESQGKTSSTSAFFFNSEDSEAEEDVPRKISTTIARPSSKFSRRTQPSSSNSVRSSSIRTTVVPDAPRTSDYGKSSSRSSNDAETLPEPSRSQDWQRPIEQTSSYSIPEPKKTGTSVNGNSSSRSSYATETLPSASSQTKRSDRSASQEWRRPVEQAAPKPIPESKRSSRVETSNLFPREKSSNTPMTVRSERTGATETSKSLGSKSFGREQSSNPPKIERSESSESSKSSGFKSFARDQSSNLPAKVVRSQRSDPSKFSPPKSFTRDQTSNPPPKIVRSESAETPKSSSSVGKASHVHPKLPDSDDLFAKFTALKQNRQ
ncbi:putative vacuolar protein sorting-associated protein Ist1 [Rosa chinensis]|uniref:Putative vacuolar protein sorting-associated protein Ist1 n=1 Tax=Rosa chinensis TaxID=74649 RepID=A0A2P6RK42_ROSCH|nr:putative vacuolar protein sorting-associated protein Ist1 [Rosa chinensis]